MPSAMTSSKSARESVISRHLKAVRKNPDLMRAGKILIEGYDIDRIKDVFKIDLPYAHTHIPVLLAYSSRLHLPPELYLKHDDWPNFVPRLDSIASYDMDCPETTVAMFQEVVGRATSFQLNCLRRASAASSTDPFIVTIDDAVVRAFEMLAQIMPNQLQLVYDASKGEIAWTVQLVALIPNTGAEGTENVETVGANGSGHSKTSVVEGRYLIKGKTSVTDIHQTKCSVEMFSQFLSQLSSFFSGNKLRLSLPMLKDDRLDHYVESIAALVQETVFLISFVGSSE